MREPCLQETTVNRIPHYIGIFWLAGSTEVYSGTPSLRSETCEFLESPEEEEFVAKQENPHSTEPKRVTLCNALNLDMKKPNDESDGGSVSERPVVGVTAEKANQTTADFQERTPPGKTISEKRFVAQRKSPRMSPLEKTPPSRKSKNSGKPTKVNRKIGDNVPCCPSGSRSEVSPTANAANDETIESATPGKKTSVYCSPQEMNFLKNLLKSMKFSSRGRSKKAKN